MDDYPYRHLIATSAASLLAIGLVMSVTCALAMRWRKHSIVDVVWGLGFAVVAMVCFASSSFVSDTDDTRRSVIVAMTVLWGLRLATHIGIRNRGSEDDPRYRALFRDGEPRLGKAISMVYLPQGVIMWFVSLPVQGGRAAPTGTRRNRCDRHRDLGDRADVRDRRRSAADEVPGGSGEQGPGDGPRTVALHAPPPTTSATPPHGGASSWSLPSTGPACSRSCRRP